MSYAQNHTAITIKDNSLYAQSSVGTHSWQEFPDDERTRQWIISVSRMKLMMLSAIQDL